MVNETWFEAFFEFVYQMKIQEYFNLCFFNGGLETYSVILNAVFALVAT
ncbi:hypothetical protein M135_1863 [Bacteroides fragilis str. S36L5]|nr:hypothetical protein M137_2220 [Bacteroides fragilis str. S36L12]EYA91478.1 hypothetical protein M135_1863 [Bacteroides fragilis str. S36L5]